MTDEPETVHACPPEGSGVMPCCGRTPFEAPRIHRISSDPDAVTCSKPNPASLREQLPDEVLALLSPRSYLSTACDTARRIDAATIRHPENADLPAWVEQLHARCRLNHKFTGEPCYCRCHRPTA